MRQTRKFGAIDLAVVRQVFATSATLSDASKRLGLSRDSLHRWIREGKVERPEHWRTQQSTQKRPVRSGVPAPPRRKGESFSRWCRRVLVLNAAEDEIVTLGQQALDASKDPALPWPVRLAASREYRACRKDLNLPDDGVQDDGDVEDVQTPAAVRPFPRRAS